MKNLLTLFFLFIFINGITSIKTQEIEQQDGTRVIFYIENEIQQPEDFVEINIEIKSQNPSLQQAISEAKQIVTRVQSITEKYCQSYAKNKKDCQNVVQTSEYQIDPIYQLVRKVPTFVAFSVTHQTTAKIVDIKNIGKLSDDLLKSGVSKINSFEWKPLQEVDTEEQAVTDGIQLINNICQKINLQLGRIVAVQQVTDYEGEREDQQAGDEQEQGQEQSEEQEEDPTVVYRFQIICQQKGKKNKK